MVGEASAGIRGTEAPKQALRGAPRPVPPVRDTASELHSESPSAPPVAPRHFLAKELVQTSHHSGSPTVAVVHLGSNGGGPKFTLELTRALRASGFGTLAVISTGADNRPEFGALGPTLALPTFSTHVGALVRSPLILMHVIRLRHQLRRRRIAAIVVAMDQVWQPPLLRLIKSRHRPQLLCVHDATMHPGDHNRLEDLLRRLQRRSADGALTFSDHVAGQLLASGDFSNERVWRSVHGAYGHRAESAHRHPAGDEIPTIGFFGRISLYKGLDICYAAIGRLRADGHRVRFSVVGDGQRNLVAGMTHPDDDIRLGWIADAEIPKVLKGFDVLALPYIEASQSGVFAYSISQGLPMVVTPVGGLEEQAVKTGAALVAEDATAEALAHSLDQLLTDSELYRSVAERGLLAARESHSWSKVAEDAGRAIRTLISAERES